MSVSILYRLVDLGGDLPITEHSQEPLRTEHARFDTLSQEMNMQHGKQFFNQPVKLEGITNYPNIAQILT
jgi:hypothetical protein